MPDGSPLPAAAKLRPADRVILDALLDGSATAREISERVLARAKEEWAARHDYFFEWGTDEEPLGAALLAHSEARKAGWLLMPWEIDRRLRSLEKHGAVERVQVEGQRPMLWSRRV